MIKAKHNKLATFLYRTYVDRLLKSNFKKFILLNNFPDISKCHVLIITPNHFSWWDGFFIEYLMRKFTKRNLYIMMLEEQLKKFWFFKYLGAFSIRQNSISSVKETMNYSKQIIKTPQSYLAFYPQGEIQNHESSHVILKRGLITLLEKADADAYVIIVSFKIFYGSDKLPAVLCRFGKTLPALEVNKDFKSYEKAFKENIDSLNNYIYNENETDIFKL